MPAMRLKALRSFCDDPHSARASVVAFSLEMTINLVSTGRYLAIHPESVFSFPKQLFIRKLPVELPITNVPITLKNRTLS